MLDKGEGLLHGSAKNLCLAPGSVHEREARYMDLLASWILNLRYCFTAIFSRNDMQSIIYLCLSEKLLSTIATASGDGGGGGGVVLAVAVYMYM